MRRCNGSALLVLVMVSSACSPPREPRNRSAERDLAPFPVPSPIPTPPASSTQNLPPATPAVSQAPHNYAFREGPDYGYIAAVSEDDRRAGRAAGDVVLFRYRGIRDGRHVIEQMTPDGRSAGITSCSVPCNAIRRGSGRNVRLTAYDPNSIIGGAFEDAMAGRLRVAPPSADQLSRNIERSPADGTPAQTGEIADD